MSRSRHESSPPSISIDKFKQSLTNPSELADLVKKLMEMPKKQLSGLLLGVTPSGYRRIHEYVASAFDRAMEVCAMKNELSIKEVNEISLLLSRGLILINYQIARGQLNEQLGSLLRGIITQIMDNIKSEKRASEIRRLFESARILVDALAVIVYRYTKDTRGESYVHVAR